MTTTSETVWRAAGIAADLEAAGVLPTGIYSLSVHPSPTAAEAHVTFQATTAATRRRIADLLNLPAVGRFGDVTSPIVRHAGDYPLGSIRVAVIGPEADAPCRVCHGEQAVEDEGRWRSCAACSGVSA